MILNPGQVCPLLENPQDEVMGSKLKTLPFGEITEKALLSSKKIYDPSQEVDSSTEHGPSILGEVGPDNITE